MTLSTSYLSYEDCRDAMNQALDDDKGIRIKVGDIDAATFFRMRLHQARKLDREKNKSVYDRDHPMHGVSEYDRLIIKLRTQNDSVYVYIEQTGAINGEVESLSGLEEVPKTVEPPVTLVVDGIKIARRV